MNRKKLLTELERECHADQTFAQEIARLLPQWFHSKWWGVALFGGAREYEKGSVWIRQGGKWREPRHGRDPAFLSEQDASEYAEREHGAKGVWSKERRLEVPYRVARMSASPGETKQKEKS